MGVIVVITLTNVFLAVVIGKLARIIELLEDKKE